MRKGIGLSRRAFLRLALLSGIAAGAGVIYQSTESVGFDRWFRWLARGYATRWLAPRPRVALAECASYESDVLACVSEVWQNAWMPDMRGARVVLKPNLVECIEGRPTFTHPSVTQAMVQLAHEQGARQVIIAEGTTFRRDAQAILDATGYTEMMEREQVDFCDLNYDDLVATPLRGGYTGLKSLLVARTICEADLVISLPKLKTHHWTLISASVKNLFGIVPGIKYGWPKNTLHIHGIPAFLTELVDALPTRTVALVDGIVGMEGDGPLFGTGVESRALVAGTDLIAVDATCARLAGLDPTRISCLDFAAWAGVGTIDPGKIDLMGVPIAQLERAFARPPMVQ